MYSSEIVVEPDTVHVWDLSLEENSCETEFSWNLLTADERHRANQFIFPIDRSRFIIARARYRQIVAFYLGIAANEVHFTYTITGKPVFYQNSSSLPFEANLSHVAARALIAVSHTSPVGIDIEYVRPGLHEKEIANNFFSYSEQVALAALPAEMRSLAFFKCWCRKEAYVKGIGDGLGSTLNDFDVSVDPTRPAELMRPLQKYSADPWNLYDLNVGNDFVAALAVRNQRLAKVQIMSDTNLRSPQ